MLELELSKNKDLDSSRSSDHASWSCKKISLIETEYHTIQLF